jgi:hypothetical protein
MQHLSCEELARLVDEPPLPHEAAHVRDCLVCRRELEEMREQTLALGSLADPEPAPAAWHRLEAALVAEGLMRHAPAAARGWSGWASGRPMLRTAAALALFLLGGAAGAALWSHRPAGQTLAAGTVEGAPVVVHPSAGDAPILVNTPAAAYPGVDGPAVGVPDGGGSGARLASTGSAVGPRPRQAAVPASVRQAERDLAEAEGAYIAALQRYASIADPASGADPATRMAALERMISTTRDALERTPDDPVINGYHLAAVRERDALRRQLAGGDKDWF